MNSLMTFDELLSYNKKLEADCAIYQSLVENSQNLFFRTDLEGHITYISPSVFKYSGYTVEEAIGMNMTQEVYLYPDERNKFLEKLENEGRVSNFEVQLKKKDGTVWWGSTTAIFFKDRDGNICGVEGITRDITALKKTNQALHESEERFRMAFHTSPDAINLNRISDGMYLDINQGFLDLTGYTREDVNDKTSLEIEIWKNEEDRNRLVTGLMKTGYVKNLEALFVKKNGDVVPGLMSASVLRIGGEDVILSITRENTELKRAQNLIVQTEKMMSLGGLAAGMAHEINNPLAGVMQNADVILRRLTDTHLKKNKTVAGGIGVNLEDINAYMEKRDIVKMVKSIKEAGSRMAKIVENMLGFAHKSDLQMSTHSITNLFDKTLGLARTDFDLKKHYDFKRIEIIKEYDGDLPLIRCEAAKIQQVFLNILSNGAHAMQEAEIEKPHFLIKARHNRTINMICIEIADNGPGMDQSVQQRIFEPFFTTKKQGKGTGIGLSVSYFIVVDDHGGKMEVASESGKGATFIIHLPTHEA